MELKHSGDGVDYSVSEKKRILDSLSGVEVDGHGVKTASARIGPLVWSGQQRFPNAKVYLYRKAVNLEQKAIFFFVFLRNTNILIIICSNNVDIW